MSAPMETLRDALERLIAAAFGRPGKSFASIPARPDVDADLLLSSALDELAEAREFEAKVREMLASPEGFAACLHCGEITPRAEQDHWTRCPKHPAAAIRSELAVVKRENEALTESAIAMVEQIPEEFRDRAPTHPESVKALADSLSEARKALEEKDALLRDALLSFDEGLTYGAEHTVRRALEIRTPTEGESR